MLLGDSFLGERALTVIAYSTFFGGHEEEYATPRDQFTWFKGFAMTVNQ